MGVTESVYKVENEVCRIVETVLFAGLCLFSIRALMRAVKLPNLQVKILSILMIIYSAY